jgi:uncharacterized protein
MKTPIKLAAIAGALAVALVGRAAFAEDTNAPLRPEILLPMAEQGDAWAQLKLGGLYRRGEGVPQDDAEAASWYAKSAAQGNTDARAMLMLVCAASVIAPVQSKACAQIGPLLQTAAAQGDLESEDALAQMYEVGMFGLPKDPGQALTWYRKAAERGDVRAESALAQRYGMGLDIPKDDVQAAFWNRKAAQQGDMLAQIELAGDYETGRGVPADEAQAVAWYLKAAQQGYPDAQRKVGTAYALGKGVPQDNAQAYMWLAIALSSAKPDDENRDAEALALKSVAERLKPPELAQAKRMAADWKPAP